MQYSTYGITTQKRIIIVRFLIQALLYCPSVWLLLMWVLSLQAPWRVFMSKNWDFLTLFIRELLEYNYTSVARYVLYCYHNLQLQLLYLVRTDRYEGSLHVLKFFPHIFLWCLWMKYFRLFEMCLEVFFRKTANLTFDALFSFVFFVN